MEGREGEDGGHERQRGGLMSGWSSTAGLGCRLWRAPPSPPPPKAGGAENHHHTSSHIITSKCAQH